MTDFWSTTKPKARKEHQCIWCSEMIQKGETYVRSGGQHDGDWQDHAMHTECKTASDKDYHDTPGHDGLLDPGGHKRGSTEER